MVIIQKDYKKKREIVTEIFLKKKKTEKENTEKINIRLCL